MDDYLDYLEKYWTPARSISRTDFIALILAFLLSIPVFYASSLILKHLFPNLDGYNMLLTYGFVPFTIYVVFSAILTLFLCYIFKIFQKDKYHVEIWKNNKFLFLICLIISIFFWIPILTMPPQSRAFLEMIYRDGPLWITVLYCLLVTALVLGLAYGIYKTRLIKYK